MNKEEALKQYKSLFPDNVEAIVLTKENYDMQLGQLQYENIELKLELESLKKEWEDFLTKTPSNIKVEKAIEYIETYIDFEDSSKLETKKELKDLLDILKGVVENDK